MGRFPEKAMARILNTGSDGIADRHRMRWVLLRVLNALQLDVEVCKKYAEVVAAQPNEASFWVERGADADRQAQALRALVRSW